jgi:hypothetical protein
LPRTPARWQRRLRLGEHPENTELLNRMRSDPILQALNARRPLRLA